MSSRSPPASPNISYVIPCSLSPRRASVSVSPPSSPLVPSTPPPPAFQPECITTDISPWAEAPRLLRFDNECVVIPESEWFPHASGSNGDDDHHPGGDSKGFKAVFGLNKMKKKVVMVNKSYSLPLWPAGGTSKASSSTDEVSESGTEDEAPTTPQRKVVRLSFKVPIPTFTPERPHYASRHPHLRSPSSEASGVQLPHSPRGRNVGRSRSPPASQSLSPILVHRTLSQSPSRAASPPRSPLFEHHHPHNALYTNPRTGDISFFPSPPLPNAPVPIALTASTSTSSAADASISPSLSSIDGYVLPELVPLRPCCEGCIKALEEALKQGEEWKEKFTRGARRRRRRSSSAASAASTSSAVSEGPVDETADHVHAAVASGASRVAPGGNEAAVGHGKRPSLSVTTTMTTGPSVPLTFVEETDEEEDILDAAPGKLTLAVVDEVEGLKRRSASGGSLNKLAKAPTPASGPLPANTIATTSTTAKAPASPLAPIPRAFLDVPQTSGGAFQMHERVASGGSVSSISSSGSGGSGSGNESGGSTGSRTSFGSRGSRRGAAHKPGKSILKNSGSNSPSLSPAPSELDDVRPGGMVKRHSYHGYPTEKERQRERELTMVNTLMNMGESSSSLTGSGRGRGRGRESVATTQKARGTRIDLGGEEGRSVKGKGHSAHAKGVVDSGLEDDDELLFPLPRSPRSSPEGTPGVTPRPSLPNTPRGSNTPEPLITPRGGSPRASPSASPRASPHASPRSSLYATPNASPKTSSPRASPYSSPRASPRMKPSPLAMTSPIVAELGGRAVVAIQGSDTDTDESSEGMIRGSISRRREVPVITRTPEAMEYEGEDYIDSGRRRRRSGDGKRPGGHGRAASEPFLMTMAATAAMGSREKEGEKGVLEKAKGLHFPHMHQLHSPGGHAHGEDVWKEKKASGRSGSTSSSTSAANVSPNAGASPSTSTASGGGKQTRKNSTSFSSIGRNLRALKGVGAEMLRGVGSIGGMGPPGGL